MILLIQTTDKKEWYNFLSKIIREHGLMVFGESEESSHRYSGAIGAKAIELINYSIENNVYLYFRCVFCVIIVENKIVTIYV